jgi:hypothetical protein
MRFPFLILLLTISLNSFAQQAHDIEGRWDLTFEVDGQMLPSWLEVKHSGVNNLIGQFVYAMGSARPIAEVKVDGNNFGFSLPKQWEPAGQDMVFAGNVNGDMISGSMVYTNGDTYKFKGVKAPKLEYTNNPEWGEPINLFNGRNLDGWKPMGENQWKVVNGILTSEKSGANLVSEKEFQDFKLHVEFRYPEHSNSGVYLRGRYEVQIADNAGLEPDNILFGGIYGFLTPTENMAKAPGKWQSFDITLIGRRVSVIANGRHVIIDRTIPGITGGALDSNEGEPGPFLIQGDHGPIEYRNIIVTPRIN